MVGFRRHVPRIQRALVVLAIIAGFVGAPGPAPATAAPQAAPPDAPYVRPAVSLSDSLIAYWRLEEASGTRLDELSGCGGGGGDLADINTVTQNTGVIGNAGQFVAASSEDLSYADEIDLNVGGNIDVAFVAWL